MAERIRRIVQFLLIAYIMVFPFTANPAAIKWKRDMMLSTEQQLLQNAMDFVAKNKGNDNLIITTHPYVAIVMNFDFFDESQRKELSRENISAMKPGDILIWDNWLSVVEKGISKESLNNDTTLKIIFFAKDKDRKRDIEIVVYEKQP